MFNFEMLKLLTTQAVKGNIRQTLNLPKTVITVN